MLARLAYLFVTTLSATAVVQAFGSSHSTITCKGDKSARCTHMKKYCSTVAKANTMCPCTCKGISLSSMAGNATITCKGDKAPGCSQMKSYCSKSHHALTMCPCTCKGIALSGPAGHKNVTLPTGTHKYPCPQVGGSPDRMHQCFCMDTPNFKDQYGSCTDYAHKRWCAPKKANGALTGGTGPKWMQSWGSLGTGVKTACCVCGGGTKKTISHSHKGGTGGKGGKGGSSGSSACQNGGHMQRGNSCMCPSGFVGQYCEKAADGVSKGEVGGSGDASSSDAGSDGGCTLGPGGCADAGGPLAPAGGIGMPTGDPGANGGPGVQN